MAEFGVSTSNKFAFLDDDAPAPKKAVKAKKEESKPKARPESARNNERGDRSERNERNNGGGRGRGGRGRGRGGYRGGGRGGKREFDRHSGTGRDKSVKKEGHGKYGWGEEGESERPRNNRRRTTNLNEQPEVAATPNENEEVPKTEGAEETPATEEKPAEPEEPEDTSVTYEEFLASKAAVEEDSREVRHVQNDDKFKGVVLSTEEFEFQLELGSGNKTQKKSRKQNAKKNVSLDEFVSTGPTSRGRGRGRGRGGKGGRGFRPPSLNDQHFPKLG